MKNNSTIKRIENKIINQLFIILLGIIKLKINSASITLVIRKYKKILNASLKEFFNIITDNKNVKPVNIVLVIN